MELKNHLQTIWTNWRTHSGECNGCPHWDSGGCNKPFYGVGNLDADVALVAHEPGSSADGPIPEMGGKNPNAVLEEIQGHFPEYFMDVHQELKETGMYKKHSPKMATCIDVLEAHGYDPYYTNVKKCTERSDGKTDQATEQCITYLPEELHALDPDVVIPFGNPALDAVREVYGIGNEETVTDVSLQSLASESVTVIPSIHFSENWFHTRLPDNMDESEYWEALATRVDDVLF